MTTNVFIEGCWQNRRQHSTMAQRCGCRTLDRSFPTKMRSKMKHVLRFELHHTFVPSRPVRDQLNLVWGEWSEVKFPGFKCVLQKRQFLPRKSHQRGSGAIHRNRMCAGQNHAARL